MDQTNLGARVAIRPAAVAVVLAVCGLLAIVQYETPDIMGTDGPFHARLSFLIGVMGVRWDRFPWLPYTRLGDEWVDHELAWHLAAVPFTWVDPERGAKAFSVLQAAFGVISLYLVLVRFEAPVPLFLALLPLVSSESYLVRLLQFRPQTVGVAFYLWGVVAMLEGRRRALFVVTWLLTWLHGSFVVLVGTVVCHWLATLVGGVGPRLASGPRGRAGWALAAAAVLGAVAGLVIHPHFPRTLEFVTWHTGVALRGEFHGGEWTPFTTWELLRSNSLVMVLLTAALLVSVTGGAARPDGATDAHESRALSLFLVTVGLFLLGMRQSRFIEYWVPAGVVWAGATARARLGRWPAPASRVARWATGIALGLLLGLSWCLHVGAVRAAVRSQPGPRFTRVAAHLARHLPRGETVYHSGWDLFPALFLADLDHRYVSGLDPNFLAKARPDLALLMEYLGRGGTDAPSLPIRMAFGARYALVSQRVHPALVERARDDPLLEAVMEESDCTLYRLRADPGPPLLLLGSWLLAGARTQGGRVALETHPTGKDQAGLVFEACRAGSLVDLPLVWPEAGRLRLSVDALSDPPQARYELCLDRRPLGPPVEAAAMGRPRVAGPHDQRLVRLSIALIWPGDRPVNVTIRAVRLEAGP